MQEVAAPTQALGPCKCQALHNNTNPTKHCAEHSGRRCYGAAPQLTSVMHRPRLMQLRVTGTAAPLRCKK